MITTMASASPRRVFRRTMKTVATAAARTIHETGAGPGAGCQACFAGAGAAATDVVSTGAVSTGATRASTEGCPHTGALETTKQDIARNTKRESRRNIVAIYIMGAPKWPTSPQRSERPGEAVALLDIAAPQAPQRSERCGEAVALLDSVTLTGLGSHPITPLGP